MKWASIFPIVYMTLVSAPTFAAGSKIYKALQFATSLSACQQMAPHFIENFSNVTGYKTLGASCSDHGSKSVDLLVEYVAPLIDVPLVSNFPESAPVTGLYDSKTACEAAVVNEVQDFTDNTGLRPFAAYCFTNQDQWRKDTSWTLRLDAFGNAKKKPQFISNHLFGKPSNELSRSEDALLTHLSAFGGSTPRVSIVSKEFDTYILATYYAVHPLPLTRYDFGTATTMESCNLSKKRFEEIIAKSYGQVPVFLCLAREFSPGADMYALASTIAPLAHETSGLAYSTMAACEGQRAHVEQNYRTQLNRNVIGSLCSWDHFIDSDTVWMRLFWLE